MRLGDHAGDAGRDHPVEKPRIIAAVEEHHTNTRMLSTQRLHRGQATVIAVLNLEETGIGSGLSEDRVDGSPAS